MYEDLIKNLRELSEWGIMDYEDGCGYANRIVKEAADVIGELLAWHEADIREIERQQCLIESLQKALFRFEEESGILDELPMVNQSTSCDTCAHKGNVDFHYCHICNNEANMYKPKEEV